jgi:hypothetical protein
MKGMKVMTIAMTLLALAACSNNPSPSTVAKNFMTNFIHGNFEEASKLAIPSMATVIKEVPKHLSADKLAKLIHPKAEFSADKEVISKDGGKATVTLSTNADKGTADINLLNMGGSWKVSKVPGM